MKTRLLAAARRLAAASLAFAALTCASAGAHAASLDFCDRASEPTADQKDTMLRFAGVVKDELAASGRDVALIARSGIDLHRIGTRYSHAGVALRESANGPWSVRQLYYACDERKPRIFDQGMAGFLFGTDDVESGWISLVLLPPEDGAPLAAAALDNVQSLRVLGSTYSANAYPFSTRYQNCNQWVMELLADAWGGIDAAQADARAQAQAWLAREGYAPVVVDIPFRPLMWFVPPFVKVLNNDDHPPSDLDEGRYTLSLPASIEGFVRTRVPEATRLELCHAGRRVVVHHGWDEIAEGCLPGPGDKVIELAAD